MAIYTTTPIIGPIALNGPTATVKQTEIHLYGSSRIGVYNIDRNINTLQAAVYSGTISTFARGNKFFELSNHLGNVLVTVSDKRIAVDSDNDGIINYYNADVVTANDYYPFGMTMPGRKYSQPSSSYRYGFNGQENIDEIAAGLTTAMYWEYDSRIGRRWNVDPKPMSSVSPFACFANNPILFVDNLGDTIHDATGSVEKYKAQVKENIKNLESFESEILKTPEDERGAYQNKALGFIASAKKELTQSLQEISVMENSPVNFYVANTADEKLAFKGEGSTTLRLNVEKQRVEVDIYFNNIGTSLGNVGHEFKHGYQMINGTTNNGSLYDLTDEVEAYAVSAAFEGSINRAAIVKLTTGILQQDGTSVKI
jgi:RHS repeat-associated protein